MPKKKPNQTSFKKGNRAAAGGRATKALAGYGDAENPARELNKLMLFRYMNQLIHLPEPELEAVKKDKTQPYIMTWLATVFLRAGRSGDVYAFNAVMDRVVGPITQKIEIDRANRFAGMTDEQLLAEKRRLATICMERLRQIEAGPGMYYVNPPKEVTPNHADVVNISNPGVSRTGTGGE